MRRGLHPCFMSSRGIRKAIFGNGDLHRQIASDKKFASERVPSHKQKVKDDNCQAESIVVWSSNDLIEALSLQFWWSKLFLSYLADKGLPAHGDLKRIAIDERRDGVWSDQDARLIEISNDASSSLNACNSSRDV